MVKCEIEERKFEVPDESAVLVDQVQLSDKEIERYACVDGDWN